MADILLRRAAGLLKVHPRTILRALDDSPNPTYTPGDEDSKYVDSEFVRQMYAVPAKVWDQVLHGKDELHTRQELTEEFGIKENLFKKRKYPCQARRGKTVRYSRRQWLDHHLYFYGE